MVVDTIGVDPDLVAAIDALSADDGVSSEAIDLVVDAGLFGVSVPREVGGSDLPLADVVEVWLQLSWADASTGWCVFAADTALAYFGAYLPDDGVDLPSLIARVERDLISRALTRTDGNRADAARLLGLKRTTLVEKLKRMPDLAQ